jgi:hypothetical protein
MNHVILLTHDQLHLLIWALDQIDGAFPEKRDEAEYNEEEWTTLTSNIEECLDLSNRLAEASRLCQGVIELDRKDSNEI